LGAKVIAAASSDDKLEVAKKLGADYTVNYQKEDLKDAVGKITNNKFADVVYEPVGGDIFEKVALTSVFYSPVSQMCW
jgi:NADPH2:quinone reductase